MGKGDARLNAFLLMLPLFFIRFGLLRLVDEAALGRAAFFAPLAGGEKTAYLFYQLANGVLLVYPLFLKVRTAAPLFWPGVFIYLAGIGILAVSAVSFAKPGQSGLNTGGIYRFSRNPMYVGYFLYYLGCAALAYSLPLLAALLVFQAAAHWIILSEERWCLQKFGEEYRRYMQRVRRYF